MLSQPDYYEINQYGVIGDLHTAALINPDGGIDWCCMPFFDSPSLFARVLDKNIGGQFRVTPGKLDRRKRSYLGRTNILQTWFMGQEEEIVLSDFMPILSDDASKQDVREVYICRKVECVKGANVAIEVIFDPRPDYARASVDLDYEDKKISSGNPSVTLFFSREISWDKKTRYGRFSLSQGEAVYFVLYFGRQTKELSLSQWCDEQMAGTREYWERWISKCLYKGKWKEDVERAALILKLMTFKPTGAIVAAVTTSLPESIGGNRNWDYRFSWIRDSSFTLNVLFLLGYKEEAKAYMDWLINKCRIVKDAIQILYPIADEDTTPEVTLDHLEGYKGSRPVRIGNAAAFQAQLDIFGEIIDSLFMYSVYAELIDKKIWDYIYQLAEIICRNWHRKDDGMWEMRGSQQNYTHSKMLCWVGLDRAIRIAQEQNFRVDIERWKETRQKIHDYLMSECVDGEKQYFTQSAESKCADAGMLLAPILSVTKRDDKVTVNTINQVIEQLVRNKMVYRYKVDDGFKGEEGAFNICTFWLVEALALSGRRQEAEDYFNHILKFRNPLGLYSEETDPGSLQALGNFPQAFTHIGLINAALTLNNLMERDKKKTVSGHLFLPEYTFEQGKPLDLSLIKLRTGSRQVLDILKDAKEKNIELSITGHLRGVDGAGSSLDLPEFQRSLTVKELSVVEQIPSTLTITSSFKVKIIFHSAADPGGIEYVAPDYGFTEEAPYRVGDRVVLNDYGKTPNGQRDAPAYILGNIFGLRGVKVVLESISPMAIAGGMESSSAFNLALITGAGILSGADLSFSDILQLAVKLENDEFNGSTGGQGTLATLLGGAFQHIWLSGIKDKDDNFLYPYACCSKPLLKKEDFARLEDHLMLVQAGKEYIDGAAKQSRTAFLINEMWLDLLRDRDTIGFPLHQEKLPLSVKYAEALQRGDFDAVVRILNRYVDIRNDLIARWLNLMLDAHRGKKEVAYAGKYADKVFNEKNPDYKNYSVVRNLYRRHGDQLRDVRLYTFEPMGSLIHSARKEDIAIMPLGAGGPGANLVAVSAQGGEHLKGFLESQGLKKIDEDQARRIIRGTGVLKGYIPFKVGVSPIQFTGFQELGLKIPEIPKCSTIAIDTLTHDRREI